MCGSGSGSGSAPSRAARETVDSLCDITPGLVMKGMWMRVIGIDPAPKKGLTVFDGEDHHVTVSDARDFLRELEAEDDVLICWDAPLTGPSSRALGGGGSEHASDFTQRPIEQFFSRGKTGFRAPEGISVMPYSSCPHWAISRNLLGLPRVGPWDRDFDSLPFQLVRRDEDRPQRGRCVVEVHPAVAAWLWCRQGWTGDSWQYKSEGEVLKAMWRDLADVLPEHLEAVGEPADHDELDARVAFALGRIWLSGEREVVLLGDLDRGTFLVPNVSRLQERFDDFTNVGS